MTKIGLLLLTGIYHTPTFVLIIWTEDRLRLHLTYFMAVGTWATSVHHIVLVESRSQEEHVTFPHGMLKDIVSRLVYLCAREITLDQ